MAVIFMRLVIIIVPCDIERWPSKHLSKLAHNRRQNQTLRARRAHHSHTVATSVLDHWSRLASTTATDRRSDAAPRFSMPREKYQSIRKATHMRYPRHARHHAHGEFIFMRTDYCVLHLLDYYHAGTLFDPAAGRHADSFLFFVIRHSQIPVVLHWPLASPRPSVPARRRWRVGGSGRGGSARAGRRAGR